jgi:hypothetical protein
LDREHEFIGFQQSAQRLFHGNALRATSERLVDECNGSAELRCLFSYCVHEISKSDAVTVPTLAIVLLLTRSYRNEPNSQFHNTNAASFACCWKWGAAYDALS